MSGASRREIRQRRQEGERERDAVLSEQRTLLYLPCCTIAHTSASRSGCRGYGLYVRRPPPPIRAKGLCGGNALTGGERWDGTGRVHDATCRSHACSEQFGTYSWTRTRGRLATACARQRAPMCAVRHFRRRAGETDSRIRPLSRTRACSPSGRATTRAERRRRGLALLRERPTVARTPSYRAILPRLVSAAREYLGPARASRRESAAVCPPPLLRLPRTTTAHGRVSRAQRARLAQAVSGYVNDPQPGVVRELYPWTAMCVRNVDVHVSCSSHVDAQLAAFFIDPRAK